MRRKGGLPNLADVRSEYSIPAKYGAPENLDGRPRIEHLAQHPAENGGDRGGVEENVTGFIRIHRNCSAAEKAPIGRSLGLAVHLAGPNARAAARKIKNFARISS